MVYKELSDNELITFVKRGNNDAIKELRHRHHNLFVSVVNKYFNCSPLLKDEILSSEYIFLHEIAKKFRKNRSVKFSTFYYSQLRFKCLHRLHKETKNKLDISDFLSSRDNQDNIHEICIALEKLDKRTQYIIRRKHFSKEKASLNKIGKELGLTAEGVRLVYKQGISKLKESICHKKN